MMDQLLVLHLIQTLQMFLCDYAEFLQYCRLTALNHFPGQRKQAHGQMQLPGFNLHLDLLSPV